LAAAFSYDNARLSPARVVMVLLSNESGILLYTMTSIIEYL
jgi:hypothetical protein